VKMNKFNKRIIEFKNYKNKSILLKKVKNLNWSKKFKKLKILSKKKVNNKIIQK
jgi:hypothetical protein